jgi:lipopolysaccharide/colanic/teichoic acid biosynthesis glycosyltransferase
MTAIDSQTDRQLQKLEQRLNPSPRRRARLAAARILWRLTRRFGSFAKRLLDIVVAATALIAALPVMLLAALLVKITDGGPVLYWQTRVGKWGKTFRFPKFRSMVVNAEALQKGLMAANQHGHGVTFKIRRDPRITWIGRILRKTSIDELPQFWNVLRGDMSLVGPRPPLPFEVEKYQPWHRRRVLEAKPGITGAWQVKGRSRTTFDEMVRMDLEYARTYSLWTDIKILAATPRAMFKGAC